MLALYLVVCGGAHPGLALAQTDQDASAPDDSASVARAEFERGSSLIQERRFMDAVQAFERSFELFPRPGTAGNLAMALRESGRPTASVSWLDRLLSGELGELSPEMRTLLEAERRTATSQQCRLHIEANVEARVQLDDGDAFDLSARGRVTRRLDPGSHSVSATAPERVATELRIVLSAGAEETIVLELAREPVEAFVDTLPTGPEEPDEDIASSPWLWLSVILGALAIGGAVTAAVLLTPQRRVADPPIDSTFGTIMALTLTVE